MSTTDPGAAAGAPTLRALRLIEAGRIEVGAMIPHRYPSLDDAAQAFTRDYHLPGYAKGVVTLPAAD
jgi:threonine dehydrogenase-like Zn-dependent dehydrogenase